MTYQLSANEIGTIIQAVYRKYDYLADQFQDVAAPFPMEALASWKQDGVVSLDVTQEAFIYQDRNAQARPYNPFLYGRLHLAITRGGASFDDLLEIALYAPVLKPDTFAIRVAEMNTRDYLVALGNDNLLSHYFTILDMLIAYHRNDLHPLVLITGQTDPHGTVTTPTGFASELYHQIGGSYDWQAIAHFMVYDSKWQGEGEALFSKHGDSEVYKSPIPTACKGCRSLYLLDGKPKRIQLSELLRNGAKTIKQRTRNRPVSVPTCGPSHLWCSCQGPNILTGMEWWF